MPDFLMGDYVWFEHNGEDYYGTIIAKLKRGGHDYADVDTEGGEWSVPEIHLTLIYRKLSTDDGADEYEEIMSLQSLSNPVE